MFGKKMLAFGFALALFMCGALAVGYAAPQYAAVGHASATATSNITGMIEDLVPSFVLLVFVMVFMLMLMTIVDRIGKR